MTVEAAKRDRTGSRPRRADFRERGWAAFVDLAVIFLVALAWTLATDRPAPQSPYGSAIPPAVDPMTLIAPWFDFLKVALWIGLVYELPEAVVGLTPGKLALGLSVRSQDCGPATCQALLRRFGAKHYWIAFALLGVVGGSASMVLLAVGTLFAVGLGCIPPPDSPGWPSTTWPVPPRSAPGADQEKPYPSSAGLERLTPGYPRLFPIGDRPCSREGRIGQGPCHGRLPLGSCGAGAEHGRRRIASR